MKEATHPGPSGIPQVSGTRFLPGPDSQTQTPAAQESGEVPLVTANESKEEEKVRDAAGQHGDKHLPDKNERNRITWAGI